MISFWTFQRAAFEISASLVGPELASLIAGFAVIIGIQLYLTRDGQRYLDQFE